MIEAKAKIGSFRLYGVKTKADGTKYNLGLMSASDSNWIVHYWLQLRVKINGILTHKSRAC